MNGSFVVKPNPGNLRAMSGIIRFLFITDICEHVLFRRIVKPSLKRQRYNNYIWWDTAGKSRIHLRCNRSYSTVFCVGINPQNSWETLALFPQASPKVYFKTLNFLHYQKLEVKMPGCSSGLHYLFIFLTLRCSWNLVCVPGCRSTNDVAVPTVLAVTKVNKTAF